MNRQLALAAFVGVLLVAVSALGTAFAYSHLAEPEIVTETVKVHQVTTSSAKLPGLCRTQMEAISRHTPAVLRQGRNLVQQRREGPSMRTAVGN